MYDVYGKCWTPDGTLKSSEPELYGSSSEIGLAKVGDEIKTYKKAATPRDYTPFLSLHPKGSEKHLQDLPPCTFGTPIIEYFNDNNVRNLLHIPQSVQAWDLCTSYPGWTYNQDNPNGSQWIYEYFIQQKEIRVLFYSGDTDGAVPTWGSQQWIAQIAANKTLALEESEPWRAYMVDGQVGGYIQSWNNGLAVGDVFTFITVHGAGHMVPQFKRSQSYWSLMNWVKNIAV